MAAAKSFRAEVERIEEVGPATRSFFLRLSAGHGIVFEPGQFISLTLPVSDKPIVRAYSLASDPASPELVEICLDLVPEGPGSTYLFGLAPRARVDFTGPWGSFVLGPTPPARCILIAAGTGIVALRPMAHALWRRAGGGELRLLHSAPDHSRLLYRAELEAALAGAYETILGGDDVLYERVSRSFVEADDVRDRHFFVCGVGDIVTRLRDLLRGAGYERRAVHYEKW